MRYSGMRPGRASRWTGPLKTSSCLTATIVPWRRRRPSRLPRRRSIMPDLPLRPTMSRRLVLGAAAVLAAPALLTHRAAAAETCVVGTWGGDYARLLRENIDDPILKPMGVEVVQDVGDETPRVAK